jgi:hypothetical protein
MPVCCLPICCLEHCMHSLFSFVLGGLRTTRFAHSAGWSLGVQAQRMNIHMDPGLWALMDGARDGDLEAVAAALRYVILTSPRMGGKVKRRLKWSPFCGVCFFTEGIPSWCT